MGKKMIKKNEKMQQPSMSEYLVTISLVTNSLVPIPGYKFPGSGWLWSGSVAEHCSRWLWSVPWRIKITAMKIQSKRILKMTQKSNQNKWKNYPTCVKKIAKNLSKIGPGPISGKTLPKATLKIPFKKLRIRFFSIQDAPTSNLEFFRAPQGLP